MKSLRDLIRAGKPPAGTGTARRLIGIYCSIGLIALAVLTSIGQAAETDALRTFLRESFGDTPLTAHRLWLNADKKAQAAKVLNRPLRQRALRYWGNASHTVWVLNEVGKERPITTAVEIENGAVKRVRVLTYRESRGGEVQADWFLNQFIGLSRQQLPRIHQRIDAISGATLSVNALKKQVSLALLAAGWLAAEATADSGEKP